jgi:hypothetical protein
VVVVGRFLDGNAATFDPHLFEVAGDDGVDVSRRFTPATVGR